MKDLTLKERVSSLEQKTIDLTKSIDEHMEAIDDIRNDIIDIRERLTRTEAMLKITLGLITTVFIQLTVLIFNNI